MFRRKFNKEFKEAALRKVRGGTAIVEVARACRVDPAILRRWQKELDKFGVRAFGGYGMNRHTHREPRSRSITLHVSPDEFDALKITASAAGFQSLAEFARFRMFRAADEPPLKQAETILDELTVVAAKLTQRLSKK
jgi:transposase-like protein